MKKLVAGNWKMNGSLAANASLVEALRKSRIDAPDLALCVPYPYLGQVREALAGSGIALGAQNVSEFAQGAYTGEVSAAMLAEFGCRYVIVGHSERRTLFGENHACVARKAAAALNTGLEPIVCVGETAGQRQAGQQKAVVTVQLDALSALFHGGESANITLAYEPVWAIGTGQTATAEQVAEMHTHIRDWLRTNSPAAETTRILYGGSVKPDNAETLFNAGNVNGGLIGGASLVANNFLDICRAAAMSSSN